MVHPDLADCREFKQTLYDLCSVVAGITIGCKIALPAGVFYLAFFVRISVLVVVTGHVVMGMVTGNGHQWMAVNGT